MIVISSEMEEVLGISDRIAVMHEGRLTGILDRSQFSEEAVMRLATGTRHQRIATKRHKSHKKFFED